MGYAISWDDVGQRLYETGTRMGVLYPRSDTGTYPLGVPWNGLTGVTESPEGGEPSPFYADDIKYLELTSVEEFGGTIEAYTYPDEFAECDGSAELEEGVTITQQSRKTFGFAYRTVLGNDVKKEEYGYKLHLVYGALASPSEKAYETINDNPDAIVFSWDFTTTPVPVTGFKPSSKITIDSTKVDAAKLKNLEDILYGKAAVEDPETPAVAPRLPLPDEIKSIFAAA